MIITWIDKTRLEKLDQLRLQEGLNSSMYYDTYKVDELI